MKLSWVRPAIREIDQHGREGLRWIAERRVRLFWVIPIFWPVMNFDWRCSSEEAWGDAARDHDLRESLRQAKEDI